MNLSLRNFRLSLPIVLIIISGFACVSRYRLDLNLTLENKQLNAKVAEARYVDRVKFSDIYSDSKLEPGNFNCIVLTTNSRGKAEAAEGKNLPLIRMDENISCKLYIQLPSEVLVEQLSLENRSFVQLLGRYEIPADDKIYKATAGTVLIDSIVDSKMLFGTIDGTYSNQLDQEIAYLGKFKIKIEN